MVRVVENCYQEMNPILDQAPDGIFVPRIRSRQDVETLVRTVKYPPEGVRGLASAICPVSKYLGWGSAAAQIQGVNRNLVIGIQIETAEAMENLHGVVSVPGVDIALVGPDDLSTALGIPGQTAHTRYVDAVKRVIEVCQQHGVLPGIACLDPEQAHFWIERGMKVIWYAIDNSLLWTAGKRHLEALRGLLAKRGQ
jgi:2-keto-3-deoxy-L-rhamnonate aldolase RhmA